MDVEWTRDRLERYVALCDNYDHEYEASGYSFTQRVRELSRQAEEDEPTIKQIFRALDSSLLHGLVSLGYGDTNIASRCRQALGVLRDREEWQVRLAPAAPSLSADALHPTIWTSAVAVWATGEYKIAVQQAAMSLSAHIKAAAKIHLNERELVAQVFSPEAPKPGSPRLHLPGDRKDKNWQSAQQGLHLIAQGAFAGIRNIAVHDDTPWTEHEALEHLAVLSVIARWADKTTRVTD